jgi:transcriptional regulator with XRE-family HTH domain
MSDMRLGAAFKSVRVRSGRRQTDIAAAACVSATTVSRIERGRLREVSLDTLRAVGSVLELRIDVIARWRGGELDRLINARHSALHEAFAARLEVRPGWTVAPEASFSIYGERGVVDVLSWHGASRTLLVVELKSDLVDIQELIGSLDRKRRLAPRIGRERGWDPIDVAAWIIVAESRTNRRHVATHRAVLRAGFPDDGHRLRSWLAHPDGPVNGLSFLPYGHQANLRRGLAAPHRVRVAKTASVGSKSVSVGHRVTI